MYVKIYKRLIITYFGLTKFIGKQLTSQRCIDLQTSKWNYSDRKINNKDIKRTKF